LLPLAIVTVIVLSPGIDAWHAVTGAWPHWFATSDDAYTLLIARGLRQAFPPADLSWSGTTLHYHMGGAMLTDLLSRVTFLPPHAIFYGVLPLAMKLILIAAILEVARRVAPDLDPRLRVWAPLAVGGFLTVDWFAVLWHLHDVAARGTAAMIDAGLPMLLRQQALFSHHAIDMALLAVAFFIVLVATWERTTVLEKSSLLFAIFLAKQQVFLAAGAAYGIAALIELRRRNARPFAAGVIGLGGVLLALPSGSTYGSMARLTPGCGGWCHELLEHHGLASRVPHSLLLPLELLLFVAGLHLFAWTIIRAPRRGGITRTLLLSFATIGPAIALVLRLVPNTLLRARFLAIYSPVADKLFMPLPVYLDRILDIAVMAAMTTLPLTLPLLALPLAGSWMQSTGSRAMKFVLASWLAITLIVSAWNSSFIQVHGLKTGKEIAPDAMAALRSIPDDVQLILTNDLAYDDQVERHLPFLNIWAPASSGKQFYSSAFMFHFQYQDSVERQRKVLWFFNHATDEERIREGKALGIDLVLLRTDIATGRPWHGWRFLGRSGRYELYQNLWK
jgi:hypothetical protein